MAYISNSGDELRGSDVANLQATAQGDGVMAGLAVTATGTPDLEVHVATGSAIVNGTFVSTTSVQDLTVTTGDATNPRLDLVSMNSSGTSSITDGVPASTPVPPDLPADEILLALISVVANDTAISNDEITDKRVIRTTEQGVVVASGTGSTTTTSGNNELVTTGTLPAMINTHGRYFMDIWVEHIGHSSGNNTHLIQITDGTTTRDVEIINGAQAADDRYHYFVSLTQGLATNTEIFVSVQGLKGSDGIGTVNNRFETTEDLQANWITNTHTIKVVGNSSTGGTLHVSWSVVRYDPV